MAQSIKHERSVMTHEEFEILSRSHQPALREVDDEALVEARRAITDLRSKERTFVRRLRRTAKGRAEPRGSSHPGEVERPSQRKQFFSAALKRLNAELTRRRKIDARETLKASAQKALELKSDARRTARPAPTRSSSRGMRPIESGKTDDPLFRATVGRVSQRTKNAQAAKDNRA